MSEIYDLQDYAFAKKMVEEIPTALEAIEQARQLLYSHNAFAAIAEALETLEVASLRLGTRLPYYEQILNSKGELP